MSQVLGGQSRSNQDFCWRYERKWLVEAYDKAQVECMILAHPAFFREIYAKRRVTSIYLDTENLCDFLKHESGAPERAKSRIRWYGEGDPRTIKNPTLEFKIKRGDLGAKCRYDLTDLELTNGSIRNSVQTCIQKCKTIPPALKDELKMKEPVLRVSYLRRYFSSMDKKMRLTLDDQIEFAWLQNTVLMVSHRCVFEDVVLELKYAPENDRNASLIGAFFPFRMIKNSKYMTGLQRMSAILI